MTTPLIFQSAQILNLSIGFILKYENALSESEKKRYQVENENQFVEKNLLYELDRDENVAVARTTSKIQVTKENNEFFDNYMRRPEVLSDWSLTDFHAKYKVERLGKRKKFQEDMLIDLTLGRSREKKVVVKRSQKKNRPQMRHIINIIDKGDANVTSPTFAAAALVLHIPFRKIEILLRERTITQALNLYLKENKFSALRNYVHNCHEISKSSNEPQVQSCDLNQTSTNRVSDEEHVDNTDYFEKLETIDYDDMQKNQKFDDPICTPWKKSCPISQGFNLQVKSFQHYLNQCKQKGIAYANRDLESLFQGNEKSNSEFENRYVDPYYVYLEMQRDLEKCKTSEQKIWMNSVLSYILVYYSNSSFNVPQNLIDLCKENHPIFTNAPGGCGKSWLISMLSRFVHSCIIPNHNPVFLSADEEKNLKSEFEINFETPTEGRFGRVLVLAPSGISAANCNGYTFHNALSFSRITMQELTSPISEKKKFKLRCDFFKVQIIVIDEYSMVSLTSLTLLDKVLKEIFPQKSRIPFTGIPVIILGDGFQLLSRQRKRNTLQRSS